MRSSSSELLLDEQEELRKQKLKELTKAKKQRHHQGQSCRQRARFYMTTMLAVFSMSAGSSLLFLVPLYVDPAISTLVANFVPEPVTCITTRREDLTGLFNCTWSSCREGCTSDMYYCTHIYVRYNATPPYRNDNETGMGVGASASASASASATSTASSIVTTTPPTNNKNNSGHTKQQQSPMTIMMEDEAILLVNIKGCGYPPDVLCNNFTSMYGIEGTEFPCYHSRENKTVVLTHYNRDEQVGIIIHYFAVPFVITLATSAALCVMHCDCRCQATTRQKRDGRRPRMQELR